MLRFFLVAMLLVMPLSIPSAAPKGDRNLAPRVTALESAVDKLTADVAAINVNIAIINSDLADLSATLDEHIVVGDSGSGSGGGGPMPLADSGPISATVNGDLIENLRVTADCEVGIRVDGYENVTIRNVEIHHSCTHGISANFADGLTIQDVRIVRTDVPQAGPAPTIGNNIHIANSHNIRVTRAQLWRGSSGFWSVNSFDAQLRFIEGHDFRGPFPRGQLAQFDKSSSCLLENFSAENPVSTSWVEDNVSIYRSFDCVIRLGLLDGNNAPSGVGVMFELRNMIAGGLVEDVDTIRQMNGSFSSVGGQGVIFRRTRARDNSCVSVGRGDPLSGGLIWASFSGATGTRIEDSAVWNQCRGQIAWDQSTMDLVEIVEEDFPLRAPIRLTFPWD